MLKIISRELESDHYRDGMRLIHRYQLILCVFMFSKLFLLFYFRAKRLFTSFKFSLHKILFHYTTTDIIIIVIYFKKK